MNLQDEARRLLSCEELRGRVPQEVADFLRMVAGQADSLDERILWGVVANAGRLSREIKPRWCHVSDATGLGSNSSAELSVRFGFDPEERTGGRHDPASSEASPYHGRHNGACPQDWIQNAATNARDRIERALAAERSVAVGKVSQLPDGYRIEVQHAAEQWMVTAYTLVTPDKRRWSPAPMEPGYCLLAALSAPPADPAKAEVGEGLTTSKQAWWAGARAGLGVAADMPREQVATILPTTRTAKASGRAPDGYAYRYQTYDGSVIRFGTGGREINGAKPIESIPYWLATPPASAPGVTESMIARALKAVVCSGESVEREIVAGYKNLIPGAQVIMAHEVIRTALTAALQQEGKSYE